MPKKKRVATRRRVTTRSKPKNKKWFIFFMLPVLAIGVYVAAYNPASASVLGVSTVAFRSATVRWQPIPNAVSYNIYYKTPTDTKYTSAVTNIPTTTTSYTINYLKKNTKYQYMISAVNGAGAEFWFSPQKTM